MTRKRVRTAGATAPAVVTVDPVVAEVRAARQKLWRRAGGTIAGLLRLLDRTVPRAMRVVPAKRKRRTRLPAVRRRRAS